MFSQDNEDEPASVTVSTAAGNRYDIHNISGKMKARLIAEGEVNENAFATPANMSGKKLKEFRARHSKNIAPAVAAAKVSDEPNNFKVGDLITHRGFATEVIKVHSTKGVLVRKREGGKTWIHHTKVEEVKVKED